MPTLCDAMGIEVPTQCDGFPLTPFLRGERPAAWRDAAYYEWDWRDVVHSPRRSPVAVGSPPRTAEPGGATQSRPRVRPLRRRVVALLRSGQRPDVADRGQSTQRRRARRGGGHVELALAQPRPHDDRACCCRTAASVAVLQQRASHSELTYAANLSKLLCIPACASACGTSRARWSGATTTSVRPPPTSVKRHRRRHAALDVGLAPHELVRWHDLDEHRVHGEARRRPRRRP